MDKQIYNFIKILNSAFSSEAFELDEPDWEKLYNMAAVQSVIPLFNEGAAMYDEIPPQLSGKMFSAAVVLLSAQAQRTEEFLETYKALTDKGIRPITVKGIVCRITYGDFGDHRPSCDEDIYIKKEEFNSVREILEGLGYQMEDVQISESFLNKAQEVSFTSPNGLKIEVHVNLFGVDNSKRISMNKYFENAFDSMVEIDADTTAVYTLDYTANYLFLFLHLYKHFSCSGVGIRQVLDLCLFDKAFHDKIDFKKAEKAICRMNADKLYGDVAEIGKMLGFTIKTELKGCNPELLLTDMDEGGVFGTATEERTHSRAVLVSSMDGEKMHLLRVIFPSAKMLQRGYPIIKGRPWMLPVVWVQRWFRYLGKTKKSMKSVEIGKQRLELMKKYGLTK